MRVNVGNVNRLFTLVMLFGAVATLSVMSIQYAIAMPDPGASGLGGQVTVDNVIVLAITETDNPGATTTGVQIYVYNQATDDPTLGTGPVNQVTNLDCTDDTNRLDSTPAVINDPVWRLEKTGGDDAIGYIFDGNPAGIGDEGQITMNFGTGDPNPISIFANSEAQLTVGGTALPNKGDDIINTGEWDHTSGAEEPNTGTGSGLPRTMSIVTCGTETGSYAVGGNFQIVLPVGGTIIPISTTALLLAGISSSAMWLIPLAALAVGSFALLRFQINRN